MNETAKAAPGKRGGGFEFDSKEKRGGRDGDRKGGRDGKGRDGGGQGFRVTTELSVLEKAMTKIDYAAQKSALEGVLKAIKPMRVKSVEQLDMNTRGKLITSLLRVSRQPKPKTEAPAEAAAPAVEAAPAEAEAAPAVEGEAAAPVEAAPAAATEAPAAEAAPTENKGNLYGDVMFNVGLIWRAVNDVERAAPAFEAAGRQPSESDLAMPPAEARPERTERPARAGDKKGPRAPRDAKGAPRGDRPPRKEMNARPAPFVSSGDWKKDVETLEKSGRTRDAGRIHETNASYADAMRLYEAGGDFKSAFRNAAVGNLTEKFNELLPKVKLEEAVAILEKAQQWDKLMELHVKASNFEAVARLYERAKQYDQAGLAWERANKLTAARKAYEFAKDFVGANRVRDLEVKTLIARGDRLGAATLLMAVGRRTDVLELFKEIPAPKAWGFMMKLKLEDEAKAFASAQLAEAEAAGNFSQKARWLETTGQLAASVDAWLKAERKDKASHVLENMGDFARAATLAEEAGQLDRAQLLFAKANDATNAERVSKLPRPVVTKAETSETTPPPEAAESSVSGTTNA